MVDVYQYRAWNNKLQDWEVASSKMTVEGIEKIKGIIIPGTKEVVALSSVDAEGCHVPNMLQKSNS